LLLARRVEDERSQGLLRTSTSPLFVYLPIRGTLKLFHRLSSSTIAQLTRPSFNQLFLWVLELLASTASGCAAEERFICLEADEAVIVGVAALSELDGVDDA
jgi:hypothetical protein